MKVLLLEVWPEVSKAIPSVERADGAEHPRSIPGGPGQILGGIFLREAPRSDVSSSRSFEAVRSPAPFVTAQSQPFPQPRAFSWSVRVSPHSPGTRTGVCWGEPGDVSFNHGHGRRCCCCCCSVLRCDPGERLGFCFILSYLSAGRIKSKKRMRDRVPLPLARRVGRVWPRSAARGVPGWARGRGVVWGRVPAGSWGTQ